MSLARRVPDAWRRDGAFAALLSLPIVGSLIAQERHDHQPLVLALAVGAAAAVLIRRTQPRFALTLAVAVAAVVPNDRALYLPVVIALYTIATRTSWREALVAAAIAATVAVVAGWAWGHEARQDHGGLFGFAIGITALCAAAVAFGLYIGARTRVVDALRERAERLQREQDLLAQRAVDQERVRIAQEIHDIVAHNVSLMVVQAQALGAGTADAHVRDSTDGIARLGRQAMAEMHATLRLLRPDGAAPALAPQPGLAEVERLVEQSRHAGLSIELVQEGRPRLLAEAVDVCAYRIVQEALTNVIKHAPGARTRVTLSYQPRELELAIVDHPGSDSPPSPRVPSNGHGLIGMHERATLFGGTLTAGPLSDGFAVKASLPYETSTA